MSKFNDHFLEFIRELIFVSLCLSEFTLKAVNMSIIIIIRILNEPFQLQLKGRTVVNNRVTCYMGDCVSKHDPLSACAM